MTGLDKVGVATEIMEILNKTDLLFTNNDTSRPPLSGGCSKGDVVDILSIVLSAMLGSEVRITYSG